MIDQRRKRVAPLRGTVKKLLYISSIVAYPIFLYNILTHPNNSKKNFIRQSTSAGPDTLTNQDLDACRTKSLHF